MGNLAGASVEAAKNTAQLILNPSTTAESAASSDELKHQAYRLKELLEQFNLYE